MKTILTQAIRADREYTQLLETAKKQFKAPKPLPLLINGLCEGAADAAIFMEGKQPGLYTMDELLEAK